MPPRYNMIDHPHFWKAFIIFLLPLIATNILQNLSGTINTIFVGQMMGVNAIAAISVFFPIMFFLLAFVIGLSAGSTVLVGQAWGAKDVERVRSIVGSTLYMTLIGGSFIAFLGVVFAKPILLLLGVDPDIMHLSLPYVRWMLAGSPVLFVYIIYTSILRGVGDSVTPLIALSLTSLIGLVVTPVLLKGYFGFPELGIIAPAVATITAGLWGPRSPAQPGGPQPAGTGRHAGRSALAGPAANSRRRRHRGQPASLGCGPRCGAGRADAIAPCRRPGA